MNATPLRSSDPSDSAPIRFAIVGYGGAGRGIHSRLIREAGEVVTAVVVRNDERKAQALADWPGALLYDDLAALLADQSQYDVVVVASPSQLHVAHAKQVAAAGMRFVLDKPIALSGEQAREVVAAAEVGSGSDPTPFTVFQNRRWDPEQLTLRAVLASGEIGEVHTFERRWERWRPVPMQRWKENDPDGGGQLLDLGPHLVDSATQLFGPVTSVYAQLRSHTTPTEDDVFLTLEHESGVISRLWAGSVVGAPGPRTRVLGLRGAYVVTSFEGEPSPFELLDEGRADDAEGWITRGRERTAVTRAPGGHADYYRAVAQWARGLGPVPVDPADAVRTAEVLDAARVSAREGRKVDLRG